MGRKLQSSNDIIQEKMGIQNIYINNIGTVIGGHTGPGVVAVFCMGDKREVKL